MLTQNTGRSCRGNAEVCLDFKVSAGLVDRGDDNGAEDQVTAWGSDARKPQTGSN
jgi:hypothetical protein